MSYVFGDNLRPSLPDSNTFGIFFLGFGNEEILAILTGIWIDFQQVFKTPKLKTSSSDKWTLNIKHRIGNESVVPSATLAQIKRSLHCGGRVLRCALSQMVQANARTRFQAMAVQRGCDSQSGWRPRRTYRGKMKQERLTETYLLHVTQTSVRYVCETGVVLFSFDFPTILWAFSV